MASVKNALISYVTHNFPVLTLYVQIMLEKIRNFWCPTAAQDGSDLQMTEQDIINPDEALEHIAIITRSMTEYLESTERSDADVDDFVADAYNLSALLTVLSYTSVRRDFFAAVKNI